MRKTHLDVPLAIVLAAAIGIKLGYLFFAFPEPSSAARLSIDELYHYKWASLIASGELLTNAPYFRAPLYPFFAAALLAVSGHSLVLVRSVQLLAGCLLLVYGYRLTRLYTGRGTALIAVLLLLLYPLTTYFEGELLLDSLFSLFALMSLYYFVAGRKGKFKPVKAGLCFALAALTRPTILVFLPIALLRYLYPGRDAKTRREGRRAAIHFAIIFAAVLSPVTAVNYFTSHQLILISYQGGINFYIGNNPDADGLASSLPTVGRDWTLKDVDYLTYRETGQKLRFARQSYFWYRRGVDYILSHPGEFMRLFARKFYFLFSGHEVSNNKPLDEVVFQNPLLSLLPVRFSLLAALAVLPLFLAPADRRRMALLYGLILLYGITVSMFFVSSRFRLPVVPLTAILAAWGLTSLWQTLRARRIDRRLFFGLVGAAIVFWAGSSPLFPVSLVNPDQSLFLRGNQALRRGEYATAVARFETLTGRRPYYENSYLNLGIAYLKQGNPDRAAIAFQDELDHNPRSAEAANNLGVVFLLRDQYDSARYYCRRALEEKPYYTEAAINLLRSARGISNPRVLDSIEEFRPALRAANEDDARYLFEEGLYFSRRGRLPEAIDNHLRVIQTIRGTPPSVSFEFAYHDRTTETDTALLKLAYYQLGYLYGLTGDYSASVRFSQQAIDIDATLKEAYINLISGYRSLGRYREADSVAGVYLSRWPDYSP